MANVVQPCAKCKKNINVRSGKPLQCDGKCRQWWHKACTAVTDAEYQEIQTVPDRFWFCVPCKENRNRSRRSTVNMAEITPSTPGAETAMAASSLEATIKRIESKLDNMLAWQKEVVGEIRGMQNTLEQLQATAETLTDEQQKLCSENYEMRRQLELNEIEIDKLKQEKLRKTFEISNVPEAEGENLLNITRQVCEKIGVTLDSNEVKEIFRAPTYQSLKSQIPPPIQVNLYSKAKRDEIIARKREKKELTTDVLNMGTENSPKVNIYVNEVLTKRNRYLFKLARDLKRNSKLKFVWFKDGRLLVRKTEKDCIRHLKFGNNSSLKLLYFNARSLNDKLTELEFLLDEAGHQIDALMITETWSRADTETSMSLKNYQCFFASRSTRRGGGSALFIHNSIHCKLLHSFCDEQNSIVAVEVGDLEKTTLVSIYRPPDNLTSSVDNFLDLLDDFLAARTNTTTIVAGDFNLNLSTVTATVQRYTNIVLSNGFNFCDRTPSRYGASLDHVTTNNTELLIRTQHLQYSLFDHDAIFIEVERVVERTLPERRWYPRTDVNVLREHLRRNPTDTSELYSVESNYNAFASQLQSGLRASTKNVKVKNSPQPNSRPWVDDEMTTCIHTKNYWFGKHRQNSTDDFNRKMNNYWKNKVTSIKRSKMREYYANRFEHQQSSITGTWNVIKEILGQNKQNRCTITDQFSTAEEKNRVVSEANTYFATVGKKLADEIPYTAVPPLNPQTNCQFMLQTVTQQDVLSTINGMSSSRSSGYDAVQPYIFKQCAGVLAGGITDIINSSIHQSRVPRNLKVSKVVTIPKTSTATSFADFRPVNIPCATDKVLQKIVNRQLTDHLQANDLLSSSQYGFRPKSNTQTALFDVVAEIQLHCDKKEKVAAMFLDLSKAFDTCDKTILLRRLSELGVNGQNLRWFNSFLEERQQYVNVNGIESGQHEVNHGVVQGSIIGPTLFNCYVNNLKDLHLHGTLFMYADDIVLLYASTIAEELQTWINEDMVMLAQWMNQHKLTVNISKTKYMLFNVRGEISLDIRYNGECIELVHVFKYLGVWLDSELKWTVHIEKLSNKLAQIAGIFRRISSMIPNNTKRNLYFSLYYCHLIYGIAIWGSANSTAIKPLQIIQNKAIKNLFGYRRRTATALIHTNHHLLTVDSVYTMVACCHIHQILNGCIHTNTELYRGEDRHRHFTRRRRNLTTNRINTRTFGQNSVLHKATMLYNPLQEDLKMLPPVRFKKQLKTKMENDQF